MAHIAFWLFRCGATVMFCLSESVGFVSRNNSLRGGTSGQRGPGVNVHVKLYKSAKSVGPAEAKRWPRFGTEPNCSRIGVHCQLRSPPQVPSQIYPYIPPVGGGSFELFQQTSLNQPFLFLFSRGPGRVGPGNNRWATMKRAIFFFWPSLWISPNKDGV